MDKRQSKSLLWPITNLSRNTNAFRQFLKDEFPLSPSHLPTDRQTRHPFHKQMVQYGDADLKRVRHAHAIDLCENIVDKICLRVQVKNPAQIVRRRSLLKMCPK